MMIIIIIIIIIIMMMMMMMMMMMIITTTTTTTTTTTMTTTTIKTLKGAVQDVLQSPHSAANCLKHVCSSGHGTITCKSSATHWATGIALVLPVANCCV